MRTCPSCGSESPKGFAFCGRCGAPLGSLAPTEERKVVTVLFCDLAGFTARSDGADPEDVRARLRPYHVCLRRETERFGGMVDKFIGDGVMAVFGIPSREDDPERAVRCALAMAEAVQELNREQPDLDLAVRIGLTTGEAVVTLGGSRETEGVVGDVVNTAARLEGVAPIGGVVVGEPTWAATSKLFDYEPLPHVRVKGKSEPLAIWRAVSARSRLGVGVDVKAATPFVDRDLELVLLQGIYGRATREASAQLVTIVGEPGVGKTRLIRELREFVDARPELVSWRQGRCLPYGEGVTFSALGELVSFRWPSACSRSRRTPSVTSTAWSPPGRYWRRRTATSSKPRAGTPRRSSGGAATAHCWSTGRRCSASAVARWGWDARRRATGSCRRARSSAASPPDRSWRRPTAGSAGPTRNAAQPDLDPTGPV
jgi:class 3 adenylate cyclase